MRYASSPAAWPRSCRGLHLAYVTVTPNLRLEVSPRLKAEGEGGREYYAHHGAPLRFYPAEAASRSSRELLTWHNETKFQT
jgi:hypothetical protein